MMAWPKTCWSKLFNNVGFPTTFIHDKLLGMVLELIARNKRPEVRFRKQYNNGLPWQVNIGELYLGGS